MSRKGSKPSRRRPARRHRLTDVELSSHIRPPHRDIAKYLEKTSAFEDEPIKCASPPCYLSEIDD